MLHGKYLNIKIAKTVLDSKKDNRLQRLSQFQSNISSPFF